ncbi:MAG TPA: LPS export ABC transporter permease LptG [Candidatus Binatia bacterium]|nr:LPS export ABC transporter permease LptG [Candidatus Binatia bacterium]
MKRTDTRRLEIGFLPLGSILDRYLAAGFLRIFFICLAVAALLYVTVDFFDRIGTLLDAGASVASIARYFLYKAPLLISRVTGFATLFATLFCLGMLTRTHEITAIRSSGISVQRIALPLLLLSVVICGLSFLWNETLVPVFAHKAQNIYKTEIKNKQQQSVLGTHDIWIRGEGSFVNVDYFDTRTNVLENVTVFLLNRDFSLRALVAIPRARWTEQGWQATEATEWMLSDSGKMVGRQTREVLPLTETPQELQLLARDAEEFTYFDLQKQIADMKSKGIDTTAYEVDLQLKLALPFVSPLMVLLAIPFALKRQMSGSISLSFALAMAIGFGYWVLTAFCVSLGHSGALLAWLSAWIPNGIFSLIALYFFTAEE